jgi:site-specific DNA-methyltransferase (adenine-specific)
MPQITMLNMDCLDFMAKLPDKAYELAITDPPYFDGPNKLGYYGAVKSKTKVKRQSYNIIGRWDVPCEDYFKELKRVSKHQIIWGINYYAINNLGTGRVVWDKKNDASTFSDGEIAYCSLIDTVKFFRFMWNGMLQENMGNKEIKIHPTQKPTALYRWLLQNYAKPGDKIFDSHAGSFSSAIACYDLGFDYVGCELDADYFTAAKARYEKHISQGTLFTPEMKPQQIQGELI